MKQEELDVAGGYVARYIVVEEFVDVFEIPVQYLVGKSPVYCRLLATRESVDNIHLACAPLHFFDYVQTAV